MPTVTYTSCYLIKNTKLNKHETTTTIIKRFNLSKENLWKSILKQNQDKLVKRKVMVLS